MALEGKFVSMIVLVSMNHEEQKSGDDAKSVACYIEEGGNKPKAFFFFALGRKIEMMVIKRGKSVWVESLVLGHWLFSALQPLAVGDWSVHSPPTLLSLCDQPLLLCLLLIHWLAFLPSLCKYFQMVYSLLLSIRCSFPPYLRFYLLCRSSLITSMWLFVAFFFPHLSWTSLPTSLPHFFKIHPCFFPSFFPLSCSFFKNLNILSSCIHVIFLPHSYSVFNQPALPFPLFCLSLYLLCSSCPSSVLHLSPGLPKLPLSWYWVLAQCLLIVTVINISKEGSWDAENLCTGPSIRSLLSSVATQAFKVKRRHLNTKDIYKLRKRQNNDNSLHKMLHNVEFVDN